MARAAAHAVSVHARAPVRVDFAGGWSDVPIFADRYGGSVVNATINLFTEVRAVRQNAGILLVAEDLNDRVECDGAAALTYDGRLDLHKAAVRMFPITGGVMVESRADVPLGSGLGTSGSLDVALVSALAELCGSAIEGAPEIAEAAFRLEAVELGLVGGRQDQYAAAIGGFQHIEFADGRAWANVLEVTPELAREFEAHLVLAYTGQTHFSSETHQRVWTAFREGTSVVRDAIGHMRDLAAPVAHSILSGSFEATARLIDENWKQQQRLHPSIATPVTRRIEAAAKAAGAWSAKAMGAGAGGCMLFLSPVGRRSDVAAAVERAGGLVLEFHFELRGVRTEHSRGIV